MAIDRNGGNHYEDQFGDRIRDIGRGGSGRPPSRPTASAGGLKVASGVGFFLLLILVFGGLRSWKTSSSSSYTSPQLRQPLMPPPFLLDPEDAQPQVEDEVRRLLDERKWFDPRAAFEIPPAAAPNEAKGSPLLTPEDVAYLPALCYLLHKEGHHTELTPARRVFDRLDDDARKLLREIATHANREPAPEKRDEILEALNKVLDDPEFYDAKYFRDVDLDDLRDRLEQRRQPGKTPAINRELLEAAFPTQIIPREDQPLTDEVRRQAVADAREELAVVRMKYDDREP